MALTIEQQRAPAIAAAKAKAAQSNQPQMGSQMAPNPATVAPAPFDQPDDLYNQMNVEREQGQYEGLPIDEPETLQSKSDLYQPIIDKPDYAPLKSYEGGFVRNVVGGPLYDPVMMPPELKQMEERRAIDMKNKYLGTGQTDTVFGIPTRTQSYREFNPAFDPNLPPSDENPDYISTRYFVDEPDANEISRMGYQVMQNVVGGVGDFVTEGKLTGEGRIGKLLPETVPDLTGEKFATDMTTFITGPLALEKGAVKVVGKVAGLAATAASRLSPEATAAIRSTYENTLKATGSAIKANAAANAVTKNMLIGLSFGVKAGKGATRAGSELTVSPNNTQGGIAVSPQTIQKTFGVSRERADDYAVMLDTPIIAGTLGTFGKIATAIKDKFVGPALGGVRNVDVFGLKANKLFKMSEKTVGFKLITRIDPNITKLAPEDAAMKIKFLSNAIQQNSKKNLSLAGAGKEIKLDTPAAYTEVAENYFRDAYASQKEVMGDKAFNDWVSEQAQNSSRELFEIRTAISSNDVNASTATKIMELFDEGSDSVAGGSLREAQRGTGQLAEEVQGGRTMGADILEDSAKQEMDEATAAAQRSISSDPEIKLFMDEANAELGSKAKIYDSVTPIAEKTFQSLKKLKSDKDAAYGALAETGAEGDPVSLLEIIKRDAGVPVKGAKTPNVKLDPEAEALAKKLGANVPEDVEPSIEISDPFLKRIADEVNADPSFGNLYNNVRNQIQKRINALIQPGADQSQLQTLYDLRDNINNDQLDFVRSQGDPQIAGLVDDAKQKYIAYKTTYGQPEMSSIQKAGETRLRGEKLPAGAGPGQGKTNWDMTIGNEIQKIDGQNGKPFREALQRAAKEGGQDIDGDVANYYATRFVTNLANATTAGSKESIGTLRSSLSGVIEGLQGVKSPMVDKLKKLEAHIQTVENTALNKTEAFEAIKKQADELRSEAQNSVLSRFVDGGQALEPTEVGRRIKKIFQSDKSVTDIKRMIKEADKLGDRGAPIKSAIKGTYLDYFKSKIASKSQLGIGDGGKTAYRMSETQAEKLFDEGGNDLANLKTVFSDQPEVINSIEEIQKTYANISKKTPSAHSDILGKVDSAEDPEQAIGSAITLFLGVLNPTSSKARRLAGPMGVASLAKVRESNAAAFNALMEDPERFAEMAKKAAKNIEDKEVKKYARQMVTRATARTSIDRISDERYGEPERTPPIKMEMDKLK